MLSVVCFPLYAVVAFTAAPSIHADFLWENGSTPTLPLVLQVGEPLGGMNLGAGGSALPMGSLAGLANDRSLVFKTPFDWTAFFASPAPTFQEFGRMPSFPRRGWLHPATEAESNDLSKDAVRAAR